MPSLHKWEKTLAARINYNYNHSDNDGVEEAIRLICKCCCRQEDEKRIEKLNIV